MTFGRYTPLYTNEDRVRRDEIYADQPVEQAPAMAIPEEEESMGTLGRLATAPAAGLETFSRASRGFVKDAGAVMEDTAFGRGLADLQAAVHGTTREEVQAKHLADIDREFAKAEAVGDTLKEEVGDFEPKAMKDIKGVGSFLQVAAEQILYNAPTMGATAVTGGTLAPFVTAGEANEELKEKLPDMDPKNRAAVAAGIGGAMAMLDLVGLGSIVKPSRFTSALGAGQLAEYLTEEGVDHGIARVLAAGFAEGTTEAIQEGILMSGSALSGGEYTPGEVGSRLAESFVIGGMVGGGMRAPAEPFYKAEDGTLPKDMAEAVAEEEGTTRYLIEREQQLAAEPAPAPAAQPEPEVPNVGVPLPESLPQDAQVSGEAAATEQPQQDQSGAPVPMGVPEEASAGSVPTEPLRPIGLLIGPDQRATYSVVGQTADGLIIRDQQGNEREVPNDPETGEVIVDGKPFRFQANQQHQPAPVEDPSLLEGEVPTEHVREPATEEALQSWTRRGRASVEEAPALAQFVKDVKTVPGNRTALTEFFRNAAEALAIQQQLLGKQLTDEKLKRPDQKTVATIEGIEKKIAGWGDLSAVLRDVATAVEQSSGGLDADALVAVPALQDTLQNLSVIGVDASPLDKARQANDAEGIHNFLSSTGQKLGAMNQRLRAEHGDFEMPSAAPLPGEGQARTRREDVHDVVAGAVGNRALVPSMDPSGGEGHITRHSAPSATFKNTAPKLTGDEAIDENIREEWKQDRKTADREESVRQFGEAETAQNERVPIKAPKLKKRTTLSEIDRIAERDEVVDASLQAVQDAIISKGRKKLEEKRTKIRDAWGSGRPEEMDWAIKRLNGLKKGDTEDVTSDENFGTRSEILNSLGYESTKEMRELTDLEAEAEAETEKPASKADAPKKSGNRKNLNRNVLRRSWDEKKLRFEKGLSNGLDPAEVERAARGVAAMPASTANTGVFIRNTAMQTKAGRAAAKEMLSQYEDGSREQRKLEKQLDQEQYKWNSGGFPARFYQKDADGNWQVKRATPAGIVPDSFVFAGASKAASRGYFIQPLPGSNGQPPAKTSKRWESGADWVQSNTEKEAVRGRYHPEYEDRLVQRLLDMGYDPAPKTKTIELEDGSREVITEPSAFEMARFLLSRAERTKEKGASTSGTSGFNDGDRSLSKKLKKEIEQLKKPAVPEGEQVDGTPTAELVHTPMTPERAEELDKILEILFGGGVPEGGQATVSSFSGELRAGIEVMELEIGQLEARIEPFTASIDDMVLDGNVLTVEYPADWPTTNSSSFMVAHENGQTGRWKRGRKSGKMMLQAKEPMPDDADPDQAVRERAKETVYSVLEARKEALAQDVAKLERLRDAAAKNGLWAGGGGGKPQIKIGGREEGPQAGARDDDGTQDGQSSAVDDRPDAGRDRESVPEQEFVNLLESIQGNSTRGSDTSVDRARAYVGTGRTVDGEPFKLLDDQVTMVSMGIDTLMDRQDILKEDPKSLEASGFAVFAGTGSGKASMTAVLADQANQITGKKVLVIVPAGENYRTNAAKDGMKVAGVDLNDASKFILISSDSLNDMKVFNATPGVASEWGAVIADEAHKYKNVSGVWGKNFRGLQTDSRMFLTATPTDRVMDEAYFMPYLIARAGERTEEEVLKRYKKDVGRGNFNQWKGGANAAIEEAALNKRIVSRSLKRRAINRLHQMEMTELDAAALAAYRNLKGGKGDVVGIHLMEHMKIPKMLDQAMEDIAAGRQPIVVFERASKLNAKDMERVPREFHMPAISVFEVMLRNRLKAEYGAAAAEYGFSKLVGGQQNVKSSKADTEAVEKFQSGANWVMLMTSSKGGTGINLHDDGTGISRERSMIVGNSGRGQGLLFEQLLGRHDRTNLASRPYTHVFVVRDQSNKGVIADRQWRESIREGGQVLRVLTGADSQELHQQIGKGWEDKLQRDIDRTKRDVEKLDEAMLNADRKVGDAKTEVTLAQKSIKDSKEAGNDVRAKNEERALGPLKANLTKQENQRGNLKRKLGLLKEQLTAEQKQLREFQKSGEYNQSAASTSRPIVADLRRSMGLKDTDVGQILEGSRVLEQVLKVNTEWGSQDIERVLDFISQSDSFHPVHREIATEMARQGLITGLDLRKMNAAEAKAAQIDDMTDVEGYYMGFARQLRINMDRGTPDLTTTFLHELAHTYSLNRYRFDREFKAEVDKAFKRFVREGGGKALHDSRVENLYGLTSPTEMLAEFHSNPEFREALKYFTPTGRPMPKKGKGIFNSMYNFMLRLIFNVRSGDISIYDTLMGLDALNYAEAQQAENVIRNAVLDGTLTEESYARIAKASTDFRLSGEVKRGVRRVGHSIMALDMVADRYGKLTAREDDSQVLKDIMASKDARFKMSQELQDRGYSELLEPLEKWAATDGSQMVKAKLEHGQPAKEITRLQLLSELINNSGYANVDFSEKEDNDTNKSIKTDPHARVLWDLFKPQFDGNGPNGLGASGRKLYASLSGALEEMHTERLNTIMASFLDAQEQRADGKSWHDVGLDKIEEHVDRVVEDLGGEIALAKTERVTNDELGKAAVSRKSEKLSMYHQLQDMLLTGHVRGAYFPLFRHGDNVVVVRHDEPFHSEATRDALLKKHTGSHVGKDNSSVVYYEVQFFEKLRDARKFADKAREKYPSGVEGPLARRDLTEGSGVEINPTFLNQFNQNVDNMKTDAVTKAATKQAMALTMLDYQAASHPSQSSRRRNQVLGGSLDVQRVLSQYVNSHGHLIAALKYNQPYAKLMSELQEMSSLAGRRSGYEKNRHDEFAEDQVKLQSVIDTLGRHSMLDQRRRDGLIQEGVQVANNTGFVMMLLGPSYIAINATQPYTVGMPYLAGRHTGPRAMAALGRSTKMFTPQFLKKAGMTAGGLSSLKDIASQQRRLDPREFSVLDDMFDSMDSHIKSTTDRNQRHALELQKKALKEMVKLGDINVSVASDIAREAARPRVDPVTGKPKPQGVGSFLMDMLRLLPHMGEVTNRMVTAGAAFDLEFNKQRKEGASEAKAYDAALSYTREVVERTQFKYAGYNRPEVMKYAAGRVALMFKQYSINMMYLYARQIGHVVGKGRTKQERIEAARSLAYLTAVFAAFAGTTGMFVDPVKWFAGATYVIAQGLVGDDEWEPWNWERFIRDTVLENTLGIDDPVWNQAIAKGLPNLLGIDLSSRLGVDSLVTFKGIDPSDRDSFMASIFELVGGAPASMFMDRGFGSYKKIADGDLVGGVKAAFPKVGRDVWTMVDQMRGKGFVDSKGKTFYDSSDLSWNDYLAQGLGFQSATTSEIYTVRRDAKTVEMAYDRRRAMVLTNLYKAMKSGNSRKVQRAMTTWKKWNEDFRGTPWMISPDQLKSSVKTRAKSEAVEVKGLFTNKKRYGWAKDETSMYNIPQ